MKQWKCNKTTQLENDGCASYFHAYVDLKKTQLWLVSVRDYAQNSKLISLLVCR